MLIGAAQREGTGAWREWAPRAWGCSSPALRLTMRPALELRAAHRVRPSTLAGASFRWYPGTQREKGTAEKGPAMPRCTPAVFRWGRVHLLIGLLFAWLLLPAAGSRAWASLANPHHPQVRRVGFWHGIPGN